MYTISGTELNETLQENLSYILVQLARYMKREPSEVQSLYVDPVLTDKIMREPVISLERFCEEYDFSPGSVQLRAARNLGKYTFAEVLKIASKYNIKFKDAY